MSDLLAPQDDPSSPRVLIVEDDPILGCALETGLLTNGISVEWHRDGHSALRAFEPRRYDALLIDLGLPTLHGFDLVKLLRHEDPQVSILIVTGEDAVVERIRGLDLGADDYIVKPFEFQELLARIRAVGRRRSGHRTGGEPACAEPPALSAGALQRLLREHGDCASLRDVESCVLSLKAKLGASFAGTPYAGEGTVH